MVSSTNNRVIMYRAMCSDECADSIKSGKASFKKRFKWFSDDLEFVCSRVRDGRFNNSQFKPNAYKYVIAFDVDITQAKQVSNKEWQFDRRDNPLIKVIGVLSDDSIT